MKDLNAEQQQAVVSPNSAIAIVAGPGTGKTKTLVSRMEFLLQEKQISSGKIIAITFTKKTAAEMKERLKVKKMPFIGTFHALALHLLKIEPKIISEKQQREIATRDELLQISLAKNNFETSELVEKYNQKLAEFGLIDYDDLLLKLYEYLQSTKVELEHVLVDEFQDTNFLQYEIIKLLHPKNIFVIGDPYQSIYGFRGVRGDIFEKFYKEFPNCQKITLTKNYRSGPKILKISQALFENIDQLIAKNNQDSVVQIISTLNPLSEAQFLLNFINQKTGGLDMRDATDASANYSDFAILYRTHSIKKVLEKKLKEHGIPYQVVGGGSIWETKQMQNLISSLDPKTARKISSLVPQDYVSQVTRFDSYPNSVEKFLEYINSLAEKEYYDPRLNAVTLLTIHASKGLEFEYVFVCGFEEGCIPLKDSDIEEEKRLLYVAMTRAKKGLYLTRPEKRFNKKTASSVFLKLLKIKEISDPNVAKIKQKIQKRALQKAQQSLF